ncbi:MAG: MerR family transcriptional regulator [Gammaproteobacteria bacterium]|nr:MerR family transcriptional regulator [Gammaproteobacteria bacterium]
MNHEGALLGIAVVTRLTGVTGHTLRKWESRHRAIEPTRSSTGRRLYSQTQVRKLILLRELTEQGHHISQLSGLDFGVLENLSEQSSSTAKADNSIAPQAACTSLTLVGVALKAIFARQNRLPSNCAYFDRFSDEAFLTSLSGVDQQKGESWLVVELQTISADTLSRLVALREQHFARVLVVYGFISRSMQQRLLEAQISCLKGPSTASEIMATLAGKKVNLSIDALLEDATIPAPRFSQHSIAEMLARTSELDCECPNHVAKLLMDISAFEQYSLECQDTSPEGRELHGRLRLIAANARALFEEAVANISSAEQIGLKEIT